MKQDIRKELKEARKAIEGLPRDGKANTLDAYWEVCCGDVLVAEENLRNQDREWENTSLAEELLGIGRYLEGYDHLLSTLQWAVSRMLDALPWHPRLKLELLEYDRTLLHRIEALHGHELGESEDIEEKIDFLRRNIERADRGEFNAIEQTGHLLRDPIEWTAAYERIIDQAEEKTAKLLEGQPRGMGFCHAYWITKEQVLQEYGIAWKSPSVMNPRVMFD